MKPVGGATTGASILGLLHTDPEDSNPEASPTEENQKDEILGGGILDEIKEEFIELLKQYHILLEEHKVEFTQKSKRSKIAKHNNSLIKSLDECLSNFHRLVEQSDSDGIIAILHVCLDVLKIMFQMQPVEFELNEDKSNIDYALSYVGSRQEYLLVLAVVKRCLQSSEEQFRDLFNYLIQSKHMNEVVWFLPYLAVSYPHQFIPCALENINIEQSVIFTLEYLAFRSPLELSCCIYDYCDSKVLMILLEHALAMPHVLQACLTTTAERYMNTTTITGLFEEYSDPAVYHQLLLVIQRHPKVFRSCYFVMLSLAIELSSNPEINPVLARLAQTFHSELLVWVESSSTCSPCVDALVERIPQICRLSLEASSNKVALGEWEKWLTLLASKNDNRNSIRMMKQLIELDLDLYARGEENTNSNNFMIKMWKKLTPPGSSLYKQTVDILFTILKTNHYPRVYKRRVLHHLTMIQERVLSKVPKYNGNPTVEDVDKLSFQGYALFKEWQETSLISYWPALLHIASDSDLQVAINSMHLLLTTPFPSLDCPLWKYKCIRSCVKIFYSLLARNSIQYDENTTNNNHAAKNLIQYDENTTTTTRPTNGTETYFPICLEMSKKIILCVNEQLALSNGDGEDDLDSTFSLTCGFLLDCIICPTGVATVPTAVNSSINFFYHCPTLQGQTTAFTRPLCAANVLHASTPFPEIQKVDHEKIFSTSSTSSTSSSLITQIRSRATSSMQLLPSTSALPRDSSRCRELNLAKRNSSHIVDLLQRLVEQGDSKRMNCVVKGLLARLVPCQLFPSDEQYKDLLPNRSFYDGDLHVDQWIQQAPAILGVLSIAAKFPTSFVECLTLIKSILINLIGYWNSVKTEKDQHLRHVPPHMRNSYYLEMSCTVVEMLLAAEWLPEPLCYCSELFPILPAPHIRTLLVSIWKYLVDFSPHLTTNVVVVEKVKMEALETYLAPLRSVLLLNVNSIGSLYGRFCI